jgi:hypothetical protein
MIGSQVKWVDPDQPKKKNFTNYSKLLPIKNPTKQLNKENPISIPKTYFHKFSVNLTTKNTQKYKHPYRLYMWKLWKVSTFL